jgi:hypothetical protein
MYNYININYIYIDIMYNSICKFYNILYDLFKDEQNETPQNREYMWSK